MRIAVTGASGFVGRAVVRELRARGFEPICFLRTPVDGDNFPNQVRFDIHNIDDASIERLRDVDVLIHLAWGQLDDFNSLQHLTHEMPAHVAFVARVLSLGLSRLVVAGTCLEYGMQSGPLAPEAATRPVTPYGMAKDHLRQQLQLICARGNTQLRWARLFYMYGEGQKSTAILPLLERAIEAGDDVFDMSSGEQLRDYLPVSVVAEKLVDAGLSESANSVINVCSGQPISIRQLVENRRSELRSNIRLNLGHYPYPDYEPLAFWGQN